MKVPGHTHDRNTALQYHQLDIPASCTGQSGNSTEPTTCVATQKVKDTPSMMMHVWSHTHINTNACLESHINTNGCLESHI